MGNVFMTKDPIFLSKEADSQQSSLKILLTDDIVIVPWFVKTVRLVGVVELLLRRFFGNRRDQFFFLAFCIDERREQLCYCNNLPVVLQKLDCRDDFRPLYFIRMLYSAEIHYTTLVLES